MAGQFSVKDKVAIVTGGAAGIGLAIATALLKNGARGVTLADTNEELGRKVVLQLDESFGKNKALFLKVDVRKLDEFEAAFQRTIATFKKLDILVNNAGILDDSQWENEVDINVKGTINGMLLGFEKYLQSNRSTAEAVIVNLSSIAGISPFGSIPVYTGTKFAIHGMTLAWGVNPHYVRTGVRVVAVCPGGTSTQLLHTMAGKSLGALYDDYLNNHEQKSPIQTTEQCAEHILKVIERATTGTVWVIEGNEAPYQFELADRLKLPEKKYLE